MSLKWRAVLNELGRTIPSARDPRWPFAALLTLYGILGLSVFGFNRSPFQMLTIIGLGAGLDCAVSWAKGAPFRWPLSAYITCCSLALLLNYAHSSWVLLLPVVLAIGSKHVLTFQGRHVLNPSLFGLAASLLLASNTITTAPAYQWAGGDFTLSAVLVMLALTTFILRVGRSWLILSFLLFYSVQTAARAYVMRHHIPAEMLWLGTVSSPAFFLFTFYMLTDPATSPKTPRGQVLFALSLTLIDLYLHLYESVFTFFYAAFLLGLGKFSWLHARRAVQRWRTSVPAFVSMQPLPLVRDWGTRTGLVVTCFALLVATQRGDISTLGEAEVQFRLTPIPEEVSRFGLKLGRVFEETDPRIQHVAKWVLSVGAAAAVGDIDGDGRMDLFLTQPLAKAPYRAQVLLNRGNFQFERLDVPALLPFENNYRSVGMASGGTLVDYDGDGDIDLLVAVSFGPSRLFQNQRMETGRTLFKDVSESSGLGAHHVSIHAGFFDFNRDAHLDLFVANILKTHLTGYDIAPKLNVFDLPAPQYPGDRRALRFMHDGWHNANNGGHNELYRGTKDGPFERVSEIQTSKFQVSGLFEETRWSLAVCYSDINLDGFTDLYVANDFGPDRLYLNQAGKGFRQQVSSRYGQVGKDTYKGMNCSAADVDGNGAPDLYVSNVHHPLQAEGSLLWMNHSTQPGGLATLHDEAAPRGALNPHRFGWGAAIGDLDADGWLDILQANGMVGDRLDPHGYTRKDYWYVNHKLMQSGPEIHTYADMWGDIRGRVVFPDERRRVYLNQGSQNPGHFEDAAKLTGLLQTSNSRAVAFVDLDDDGDLDVVVTNQHAAPSLLENTLFSSAKSGAHRADRHFIGLSLIGNGFDTHRSALGTRVKFSVPHASQLESQLPAQGMWRELSSSSGLSAQSDPRMHVGLGSYRGKVSVEVHWYGAGVQLLELSSDRYHELRQP